MPLPSPDLVGGVTGSAEVATLLASVDLFSGLAPESLARLAEVVEVSEVPGGTVLMRQGETADYVFVVLAGRLQARVRDSAGVEVVVGHVGRGEVVGEMALVNGEARTATVIADRDCTCLRLAVGDFDRLVAVDPALLRPIAGQIVARMRTSLQDRAAPPTVATITLVPLDSGTEVDGAVDLLRATLLRQVPDASSIGPDRSDTDIPALELRHPLVVLVAEPGPTPWTRRCLRQSDTVVLVASTSAGPQRRDVEAVLGEHRQTVGNRVDLVLVQPDSGLDPSGTASWTRGRGIDRHHHLRRGSAEDAARICRVLRNQAVVLVLSGGGARGMAEVGVVRALQELGVPIDAVAGTSAGALVAAAVARGWGWQRIAAAIRAGVVDGRSLIDLTFPALSLASGARVTERLRAAAGTIEIEDLVIDYFCVSTNLTRKEPRVHVSGPVWRAVRASLAIPGVFPPVPDGDDVLVDGGMLENYPVRRMRLRHPGATVVGVDVGSRRDLSAGDLPDAGVVSGWDLLRARFDRSRDDRSLSLVKVLAGLTELGVRDPEGPDLADVTVEPPVLDLPILDFSRFDEAVDRGYHEGRKVLEAWWTDRSGRSA